MLTHASELMDQLCISTVASQKNDIISLLISHNIAVCLQKVGQLSECGKYIYSSLKTYKNLVSTNEPLETIFKHLKYLSKTHMQYCAILSQQNKHSEALEHAKYGTLYSHRIIELTNEVAYILSSDSLEFKKKCFESNSFINDHSLNKSVSENTIDVIGLLSKKVIPVLNELISRFVPCSMIKKKAEVTSTKLDARNLFGYMQYSEWVSGLNIGNIMQISPLILQDVVGIYNLDIEITRETLLEKIALLSVSYFCISTEKRFLTQNKKAEPIKESEYWHAKALEIACCFLPSECPLVNHIFSNYQKHYSPLFQSIVIVLYI